MIKAGFDAWLVPRTDQFIGEYSAPNEERLHWLLNFSGSAGLAIITHQYAALFIDGRYRIQAALETESINFMGQPISCHSLRAGAAADWLAQNLRSRASVGFDPWLHTVAQVNHLRSRLKLSNLRLVQARYNLIDRIWHDRPQSKSRKAFAYPISDAGATSPQKRAEMAKKLVEQGVDAAILTQTDSIAWLLNIRGQDVPYNPVLHSRALLYHDGSVDLFCALEKFDDQLRAHLGKAVRLYALDDMKTRFQLILAGKNLLIAQATCPYRIASMVRASKGKLLAGKDPCQLAKAVKNPVELQGMQNAHTRDGAVLCSFLAWFARHAPTGRLDELQAARKLYALRSQAERFQDLSFETISAFGPNGAICHYRVTAESNRPICGDSLYLFDSGSQYHDGTTDVTRTVLVGQASDQMRCDFTQVLRGHIALASARFPEQTTGAQLDALARAPLWQAGKDYDHGTGHGVGAFLNVHEGPQAISAGADTVLKPGMILSNEPGFYLDGAYGIRIENLVQVVKADPGFDGRSWLAFKTLTVAPIDRNLIDCSLLADFELAWLNAYHARIMRIIGPMVEPWVKSWLQKACAPLACP